MSESVSEILARNLLVEMKKANDGRGITQSELARISHVPQSTISLALRPKDRVVNVTKLAPSPTLERIALMAKALKTEAWLLLHPEPELAKRAHAVVAAARSSDPPQASQTLHEPVTEYRPRKRTSLQGKPAHKADGLMRGGKRLAN